MDWIVYRPSVSKLREMQRIGREAREREAGTLTGEILHRERERDIRVYQRMKAAQIVSSAKNWVRRKAATITGRS